MRANHIYCFLMTVYGTYKTRKQGLFKSKKKIEKKYFGF